MHREWCAEAQDAQGRACGCFVREGGECRRSVCGEGNEALCEGGRGQEWGELAYGRFYARDEVSNGGVQWVGHAYPEDEDEARRRGRERRRAAMSTSLRAEPPPRRASSCVRVRRVRVFHGTPRCLAAPSASSRFFSGRRRGFCFAFRHNTTNPAQRAGKGDAMTTSPMRSLHTHDATSAPRPYCITPPSWCF